MTSTTRRQFLGTTGAIAATALLPRALNAASPMKKPNVLFLAVDDLRPALGCYGDARAASPHIDRLAAQGTRFARHYCQQAVCAPSRNSVLSGLRPDTIGIYDLATFFRTTVPDAVTLPQHFKNSGYFTARTGKIFHTAHGNQDDKLSWNTQKSHPRGEEKRNLKSAQNFKAHAAAAFDFSDVEMPDWQTAENGIAWLNQLKDQPFFLAVGFSKPHLPFSVPRHFWEMHDANKFDLPVSKTPPAGAPPYAGTDAGELRAYGDIPPTGALSPEHALELIRGYYAAVSFTDAQIGRVLGELERLGLRDNTIVVLWVDHGYKLGENGQWCKHDNYELATRVPLIVSVPGQTGGQVVESFSENIDIYPSVCELAGLKPPASIEGQSLAPLLKDPGRAGKTTAFSQYPRTIPNIGKGMGRALRTERYRFVEWTVAGTDFSAVELYDCPIGTPETTNIADRPGNAALVAQLKAQLRAGPFRALPSSAPTPPVMSE